MPLNDLDYIVFDFETSGTDTKTLQPLQLAAVSIDARSLDIRESDVFQSYMKPELSKDETLEVFCKREDVRGALDVNKITQQILENAPIQSVVWKSFVDYVSRHNKKKNSFNSPIFAGHNILGFDLPVIDRMCELYGNVEKKDGKQNLYNRRIQIDSLQMCYLWFENVKELANYKLTTVMEFLGIKKDGTEHNAITDVRNTALIVSRFLKFHRKLASDGSRFKGAFK